MIGLNPRFLLGAALILIQQVLLAISTYQIGMAGQALVLKNLDLLKERVIAFFIFALLAYLVSTCVELLSARLKVSLWSSYVCKTIEAIGQDQALSSEQNRKSVQGWLGSEAPATIEGALSVYYGMISVYANVLSTLYVFHLLLGQEITALIASIIVTAYILVKTLKRKIDYWTTEIQKRRLLAVNSVDVLWHSSLYANSTVQTDSLKTFRKRTNEYSFAYLAYAKLEQVIACTPIVVSVLCIVGYLLGFSSEDSAVWGVIVAILPRSLQLFGSVHAMSVYNSKFLMFRKKIANLASFTASLQRQLFHDQIDYGQLSIREVLTDRSLAPLLFPEQITSTEISSGRFLITGRNGSGKTSLLKSIKSMLPESILIPSHASLFEGGDTLSTGERYLRQLTLSLEQPIRLVLLDEWDANLDPWHKEAIDKLLSEKSKHILIIEVRHPRHTEGYVS